MNVAQSAEPAGAPEAAGAVRARSARAHRMVDAAIAAVVAALVVLGVWAELAAAPSHVVFPVGAHLIGLAASASLLLRRDRPLLSAVVVVILCVGYHVAGYPGAAPAIALFVALFTLAERAASAWWIVAAVAFALVEQGVQSLPPNAVPWTSYAITAPAVAMLVWVAMGIASRRIRRSHARDVALARVEAEAVANERLARERLRIAREVHDVLAHTISAVSVQSAAALDAFEAGEPERARESVERIRSLATQATPQVRRAVEYLRGEDAPTHSPQPELADLDGLFRAARAGGLDVRVERSGDLDAVSAVTGLTAYRIVQEAITNVAKHAHASRVDVVVRVDDTGLTLDIVDDGAGRAQAPLDAGGFGIRGMRERAAAVGGTVRAGSREHGGFHVHAELPLGVAVDGTAQIEPEGPRR